MDGTATLIPPVEPAKQRRRPTPSRPSPAAPSPGSAAQSLHRNGSNGADRRPFTANSASWTGSSSAPSDPAAPEPAPAPKKPPTAAEALKELTRRANDGSESALDALRQLLDRTPELWRTAGDIGSIAERAWISTLSAGDKLMEESIRRRLAELKAQLAGTTATPMEALLIDLIGVTWLAAQDGEISAATSGGSIQQAAHRLRRAESSQRRFAGAVRTLAVLRSLLPGGLRPLDQRPPPNAKKKPRG